MLVPRVSTIPTRKSLSAKIGLNSLYEFSLVKKAEKRKAEAMNGLLKGKTSIQDDPNKSDVYKKLFTTCEEAKNKPQQHWVTHNPLFY